MEHVRNEAKRVCDKVKSLQGENTVSFLLVSDMHTFLEMDYCVKSLESAGEAIAIIRNEIDLLFFANLGDSTWGSDTTTIEVGSAEINKSNEILFNATRGLKGFYSVGNHDSLAYSYPENKDYLDTKKLRELLSPYYEGCDGGDRMYCYRDFEDKKLRVICLNTNLITSPEEVEDVKIDSEQLRWFAHALDAKDGWNTVILSHHPLDWCGYESFVRVIDAATRRRADCVDVGGEKAEFDFTNSRAAKIIANFHGHLHNYKVGRVGESQLAAITVPNACYGRNNSYANEEDKAFAERFGEEITYFRTLNSAEETAFSVVTVDFEKNKIYVTNYGAGYDREIDF